MKKFHKGFTLVEIMIVVAIIGLLVAIALPNFVIARKKSQMTTCKANLKQVDGAVSQYLLDNANTGSNAIPDASLMAALVPTYIKAVPTCKAGGTYTITSANETNAVQCSLFNQADYPHVL